MEERLQYDGERLTFQTALDEGMRNLISRHFNASWYELQQAVRLTTLSVDNKFSRFLFPVKQPLGETIEMRLPRVENRYFYADLGIIKKAQTFVSISRSKVLHVLEDGETHYSDWLSFQRDHASPPLLEQNTWWEYFTGYSLSKN
ncbi:hypothetical protein [Paenibacillus sp. FSL E2-0201]|uniref:hypothetical protein n=1 Tax=Paenibacillus sp. FSL E2-0201 TaxID=2954726 RepID=UPI0030DBC01C